MTNPSPQTSTDTAAAEGERHWRSTLLVAVATTTANLLGYGFNVIMSHTLGVASFGELGALLAVIVVATVPGTALQALVARRIVLAPRQTPVLAGGAAVALAVGLVVAALAPALHAFLSISSYWALTWTAISLVPLTAAFACQGVFQGRRRFVALGAILIAVQVARCGGAVYAALTHGGVSAALAASTVATAVVVAVAIPYVLHTEPHQSTRDLARLLTDLLRDGAPILGVLVLSNLDLLLARHFLSAHESGLYTAGNLVTKGAFWGPSFIAMVAYPHLAVASERAAALKRSVSMLAGIAAVGTVLSIVAGGLVPVLLGNGYRDIASSAWLFAVDGLALAGVQLALFAGLAVHDRRLGWLIWVVAVVEFAVVSLFSHGSRLSIIGVALGGALVLIVAATIVERLRPPLMD